MKAAKKKVRECNLLIETFPLIQPPSGRKRKDLMDQTNQLLCGMQMRYRPKNGLLEQLAYKKFQASNSWVCL